MTRSYGNAEQMEQERSYLAMLRKVAAFQIDGDVLTFYSQGGTKIATFEPSR